MVEYLESTSVQVSHSHDLRHDLGHNITLTLVLPPELKDSRVLKLVGVSLAAYLVLGGAARLANALRGKKDN